MKDASQFAKERLESLGRAKDKTRRRAWSCLIGACLLEVLVCAALIDYWLMLPNSLRVSGFALLLALAIIGVGGWLKLRRQPTRLKEAALDVEAQQPEAGCVVSTAAEYLSGERQTTHDYEPELVAALEAQAARTLQHARISYTKKLLRPAGFLAFALITLLLFAVGVPVASTAFKRTLVPWSKTPYTHIEIKPGNMEIPVGKNVGITNLFSGRMPKDPALHWRELEQAAWQTVPLKLAADGAGIYSFTNLQRDVQYRVTGNDAISEDYQISTYVPPAVQAFRARIAYPEYTGVKPFEHESPDLAVLRASEITFRITASTNTVKARLRFSSLPGLELTPAGGQQWTARLQATKDADYWIELADAKGHPGGNEQPYRLKVLPDKPPKVDILEPGQDIRADATNTVPLKIVAHDDFGVSEIKIIYHKLGEPEQVLPCTQTNAENGQIVGRAELALAGLNLKRYELVAYHAEAIDNNTLDGPGKGASPMYFIEITNEEGGMCKSQGRGQKVNLLSIQKQIIADTAAVSPKASKDKFLDLATRQNEAAGFGEMYLNALNQAGAPSEPAQLMEQAVREMKQAVRGLTEQNRAEALPAEERALGDLYQVLQRLPELANMPTEPPPQSEEQMETSEMVKVVLEAIQKQKKEQPSNEEMAQALEEAKKLSRSQAGLNQAMERPDQSQEGQTKDGENNANSNAKNGKQSQVAQAAEKPGENGNDQEKPGDKPGKNGTRQDQNGDKPGQNDGSQDLEQLAELERQLSEQAARLAEQLEQLAEKDGRLSQGAGQKMLQAAGQMAAAAQALRQGNASVAGTSGAQGRMNVDKVVAILERLIKDKATLADVTAEDFPPEYESVIADYLKKLSYEQ